MTDPEVRGAAKPGALFVSYDGMLEPLGQSQVIAYLLALADEYGIHLLSFEKTADLANQDAVQALEERLSDGGIRWRPMRYHKWPPLLSTVWDMFRGAAACLRIARSERITIFHGRNVICSAMTMPAARWVGGKMVADIRGFWVDERIDGGMIARGGIAHRILKPIEKAALQSADRIVTLTVSSIAHLRSDPRFGHPKAAIDVIPTCADLDRFRILSEPQRQPFVLGYIGSVGTWYLLDEMLRSFRFLREAIPDARLLIVNRNEHEHINQRAAALSIPAEAMEIIAASHGDMPRQIGRMTAGMALIKPCFSKIASAPTKLAEYLGCGVPCFGNLGVGDVGPFLNGERVGVAVEHFDDGSLRRGIQLLVSLCREDGLQERCRLAAERHFSLASGVSAYRAIYRALASEANRAAGSSR